MKIYIDPGHGGSSTGASYKGRKEQDDVLRLALEIKKLLLRQGVEVKLSRETDVNPIIDDRCKEANAWGANYFLSIHRNAAVTVETGKGAEIWVYSKAAKDGTTWNKAKKILDLLCAASGYANRGTKSGSPKWEDYGVNRLTTMESSLLEVGFQNTTSDNVIFDAKFGAIAEAIAKGLCAAIGINYSVPKVITEVITLAPSGIEKEAEEEKLGLTAEEETAREQLEKIRPLVTELNKILSEA